jgi:hypothetical protein
MISPFVTPEGYIKDLLKYFQVAKGKTLQVTKKLADPVFVFRAAIFEIYTGM